MSLLFYRRPDYVRPSTTPINSSDCARYVKRAKGSYRAIPAGLSFEEVVSNRALPPCSLMDLMDYLIYVEHNAENLQFYLWYQDYVRRWDMMPESDKELSPVWQTQNESSIANKDANAVVQKFDPSTATAQNPVVSKRQRSVSSDLQSTRDVHDEASAAASTPEAVCACATQTRPYGSLKWEPFTIQPMRDECNSIMRHYLIFDSARELNLSHKDRSQILHALQHTTHPSAFAAALAIVEAALRGQSHPNFIRWSICNGNKPRIFAVRSASIQGLMSAIVMSVVLILSKQSRWWRLFAFPLLLFSITALVSAYKGLCIIYHQTHVRELRPWEQAWGSDYPLDNNSKGTSIASSAADGAQELGDHAYRLDAKDVEMDVASGSSWTSPSLQTFGPGNKGWMQEAWVDEYAKRSILRKIFAKHVWTRNEALRSVQDKIVLGAGVWSLIISIPLTTILLSIPSANLY